MIKKLLLFIALFAAAQFVSAQGTFSVFPNGACYTGPGQNTFTATVFSTVTATSHTWISTGNNCNDTLVTSSGSTAVFQVQCCGVRTLMVYFYSGSSITGTAVTTLTFNCPPTINATLLGGGGVCAGGTNTLIASGGNSYTVSPPNVVLGAPFSPSVTTCYTVTGSSPQGCLDYDVACVVVKPLPNISIAPTSTQLCAGGSATLTASGANSYVWNVNATGSSIVVSPLSSGCFSVLGTDTSGCTSMASTCVNVNALPNIFATSNPAVPICQGDPVVLLPAGGVTYTWYPGSISMANPTLFPQNTTNYTVAGYDGTCTAYASVEVTVLPAPILMSSNNYSMCLGTSVTMTASGASTYTWLTSPPVNTPTANVMPTSWTMYTVSGTDANACSSTWTVGVYPDPSCAIVWPGDANSDGVVNNSDVFELGLYASSTGAARTPGGNSYTGQYATAWTGSGSNSQNKAHVDCNGDGTVDLGDTLAITLNFSQTHNFKTKGASASAGEITLEHMPFYYDVPMMTGVNIKLGSSTNVQNDIYGIAFDLHFDESFVQPGSAYISYPSSFLTAGNQNIPFRLFESGQGVVHCVSVRSDQVDVDGYGTIAVLYYKNVQGKQGDANFSVKNVQVINANGQATTLSDASLVAQPTIFAGLKESNFARLVSVYPNPAANAVTFNVASASEVEYSITDLTGRVIISGKMKGHHVQDISSLSIGTYILNFKSPEGLFTSKLIKE